MPAATNWKTIAALHREKQVEAVPSEWLLPEKQLQGLRGVGDAGSRLIENKAVQRSGLLSQKELDITERYTASELLDRLHRQHITSEEVTVAFCKRASLAQQLTSCLTEIMFKEGIERAKELDKQLQTTGKLAGPLHGLPISLKDSYIVKGHYATVGYTEFLRQPVPDTNSSLVDLLLDAGAVLYCKTNLPQTMMTADSENNIFGRTLNPHNTSLTAGGSTGGEGALIAFRGSPLGVGSDIAGSIRIPSLCCGIYGFKPTSDRVPFGGQSEYPFPKDHLPGVPPVGGPMANSVEDLELFMKVTMSQRPWHYDPSVADIPWRDLRDSSEKRLTIGVLAEDPDYPLHPPVRRALAKAASALENAGHKMVYLSSDPQRNAGLGGRLGFQYFSLMGPDPDTISREIGEPLVASVAVGVHPFSKGEFPVPPQLDVPARLSRLNDARFEYTKAWQQVWRDNGLDVVLAPGAATTSVPHDTYGVPVYTLMWNVLDFPAGIIPFGNSSKFEDAEVVKAKAAFDPDYIPEATDGAPCAVQIIAPRFRDEECLQAMSIVDRAIRLTRAQKL
ncbi:amidase signature domain-containing protein [Fusarium acuminatum]|uniref:Amidase signature domain-containing protein n=1 Tax=Fusarium acuminatum TaxID=5515 RepID=A0ABZ2WYI6_9HYPO